MKAHFRIGRSRDDCEKMVLPGIIFANASHPDFKEHNSHLAGFAIAVGWWDWSIYCAVIWPRRK